MSPEEDARIDAVTRRELVHFLVEEIRMYRMSYAANGHIREPEIVHTIDCAKALIRVVRLSRQLEESVCALARLVDRLAHKFPEQFASALSSTPADAGSGCRVSPAREPGIQ